MNYEQPRWLDRDKDLPDLQLLSAARAHEYWQGGAAHAAHPMVLDVHKSAPVGHGAEKLSAGSASLQLLAMAGGQEGGQVDSGREGPSREEAGVGGGKESRMGGGVDAIGNAFEDDD